MPEIYELSQVAVRQLRDACDHVLAEDYRTLKISAEGGGVKWKAGEGMWSPPLGAPLNGPSSTTDGGPSPSRGGVPIVHSHPKYLCARGGCGHAAFRHRESTEWRLINPRAKAGTGCTLEGCTCTEWIGHE